MGIIKNIMSRSSREEREKRKTSKKDASNVDSSRAKSRSRSTVGDDSLHSYESSQRHSGLFSGNHTLLKAGIGMYAVHVTSAQMAAGRCGRKIEKLKKLRADYEQSARLAGSPWNAMDLGSNIAGDAFQRKMSEIKLAREEKKFKKKTAIVNRSKRLGRTISGLMMGANNFARTMAMKTAIDSPSGSAHGVDRSKLAVGMSMIQDDIPCIPPPEQGVEL